MTGFALKSTTAQQNQVAMAHDALDGLPHQVLRTIILDAAAKAMTPDEMEQLGNRLCNDAWHLRRGDKLAEELVG